MSTSKPERRVENITRNGVFLTNLQCLEMCSDIVRIMEHGLTLITLPVFQLFHHCADFFSGFSIPYQLRILLVCYTEKQNKSKTDPGQAKKGLATA